MKLYSCVLLVTFIKVQKLSQTIKIWKSKTQIEHNVHFSILGVVLNHNVAKNNPHGLKTLTSIECVTQR